MKLRRLRGPVRALLALRARRGPYRFLVGDWSQIDDIDLAVRVLGTEGFQGRLAPQPLPLQDVRSLLLIAPHQDDEAIGAGGTLLLASAAGARIHLLYATDGVQRGLMQRTGLSAEAVARLRETEARKLCDELGAEMSGLGIHNPRPRPTRADVDRLADAIQRIQPQVLLVPWLLDLPPKHRMVNHLLWLANRCRPLAACEVWGYQVHNTLYPNGYVDITDVAEGKRALLRHFASQNENFRRYDHLAMGMSAWNARFLPSKLVDGERYLEVFFALPLEEHLRLVEHFYLRDLESTYRGHEKVLRGMRDIHQQVVNG